MTSETYLNRYRVWCQIDNTYRYLWSLEEPTTCPENETHPITTSNTSIIQSLRCYHLTLEDSPYRYRKYQIVADTTDGDLEIILKKTNRVNWDFVIVKPVNTGTVTLTPSDGETIDSNPSYAFTGLGSLILRAEEGNWEVNQEAFQHFTIPEPDRWDHGTHGKGDLLVDNGTSMIPLESGNEGEYLQVNGSEEVGLRWQNINIEPATLSNKNLDDTSTLLVNSGDNSKKVRFNLDNLSSTTTRVYDLPDHSGTLVTRNGVETLTNKSITLGGTFDANGQTVTGLREPTTNTDAATKYYVDSVASGLSIKDPVVVATTVPGNLATSFTPSSIVDGVILQIGDRILVKDQTNPVENGLYIVSASGEPTRTSDCSAGKHAGGSFVFVLTGNTYADSGWVCTSDKGSDQVGLDSLNWGQFSGAGQLIMGDGLMKLGNSIDLDLKVNGGLTNTGGPLGVDLGASSINGVTRVVNGGTGKSSLTLDRFLVGNGTSAVKTSLVVPSGEVVGTTGTQSLENKTINGNLNTITNLDDSSIKTSAAINASKIGLGTVNNTRLDYLKTLDKDIATKFLEHIPYSETSLINLVSGNPGTSNHTQFQLTRSHNGSDDYGLEVDSDPVKLSWSSREGTHQQAVQFSGATSSAGTVFGVSTSNNNGSTWSGHLVVKQDGQIGLGTTDPAYPIDLADQTRVQGNLTIEGNILVSGQVDGRDLQVDGATLTNHVSSTSGAHGVTGNIVGTSDVQILTNKTMGDHLDLDTHKIINLGNPTNETDAANKAYVDNVASGLSVKPSTVAASTGPVNLGTLANGVTLDGVTLTTGDRVLLKDQSDPTENGLYLIGATGPATRTSDYDTGSNVASTFVFVQQGTVNADSGWVCTNDNGNDVVGTANLEFSQFSGAGQISAGEGLSKTGNVIEVDPKVNGGLEIQNELLALNLGHSNITGTLAVSNGGTGATSFTQDWLIQGNGTGTLTSAKAVPTGDVVGTSDTQTLSNKTLDATQNTISNLTPSHVGLGNVANTKNHFSATSDPTVNEDITKGYSVGSLWINTLNNRVFQASQVTMGAAIWNHLNKQYSKSTMIDITRGNDSFFAVKASIYSTVRNIIFPGTNAGTPTNVKAVIKIDNASTTAKLKIVDITNNQDITEVTGMGTANTLTIENLGTLNHLSSNEAVWEIQFAGSNSNNYVYLHNLSVYY